MLASTLHTSAPLLIHLQYSVYWPAAATTTVSSTAALLSAVRINDSLPLPPRTVPRYQHHKHYHRQRFPPMTFAADMASLTDVNSWWGISPPSPSAFLRSIDDACLGRIRAALRHTPYAFDRPVDYEVERWFVWTGLGGLGAGGDMKGWEGMDGHDHGDDGGCGPEVAAVMAGRHPTTPSVNMRGMTAAELECQLRMVAARGWKDVVRVVMAVEIEERSPRRERMGIRRLGERDTW